MKRKKEPFMKKVVEKAFYGDLFMPCNLGLESNVENFKRRRALVPLPALDMKSKLFFDRVVTVKEMREFVFIAKERARNR